MCKTAGDVLCSSFEVYDLNIVSINEIIMFTAEESVKKKIELHRDVNAIHLIQLSF